MGRRTKCLVLLVWVWAFAAQSVLAPWVWAETAPAPEYRRGASWPETMLAIRQGVAEIPEDAPGRRDACREVWMRMARDFPLETDWLMQDGGSLAACLEWFHTQDPIALAGKWTQAVAGPQSADTLPVPAPSDARGALEAYAEACRARRNARLSNLRARWDSLVFVKHYTLGGSHYAYTEGQSDAQAERTFIPGAALCVLDLKADFNVSRTLIRDKHGVIRDPDVSYDGTRILFSWKKHDRQDDYHLYEWTLATGEVRQLTSGLGFADYEGIYLPNGDILFNSTRCVQTVDCWWTEVSNLYACAPDGDLLRRVTFDQVHTNYPTMTQDGRVLYTRWDYNDRGQIFPQPLFQMNPDGTGQTECYGNNAWFPTTILHARSIPGTEKIVAVLSGHHCWQRGQLAVLDPRLVRQENAGVQLIAPVRDTPADRVDAYGQGGPQFQYPYPLGENEFVVTCCPYESGVRDRSFPFGVYWVDRAGQRELLAFDASVSCSQALPLAARPKPHERPRMVDYAQTDGVYFVQDIYEGPGLLGVARGTVDRLRVVALDFRAAGIGDNRNGGEAGGALVSTPIAIGNGAWDVKRILGEAKVYPDGSACFRVPARTPVYFQAIDRNGHAVQSMRTWSTLQPGEQFACVGCHENKQEAPLLRQKTTQALEAGAQELEPFYGPPRGFSFTQEIQPILDAHCVKCHDVAYTGADFRRNDHVPDGSEKAFSLRAEPVQDTFAKRCWSASYLALLQAYPGQDGEKERDYRASPGPLVSFLGAQTGPEMLPPYAAGAAKSGLWRMLKDGHGGVSLSRQELDTIACWIDLNVPFCGDYQEARAWTPEEEDKYTHFLQKRAQMQEIDHATISRLAANAKP